MMILSFRWRMARHTHPTSSRAIAHAVRDRKLPSTNFHALRRSHDSAPIAAGLDIVTVSRRLGHGSPGSVS
jgi:integrase